MKDFDNKGWYSACVMKHLKEEWAVVTIGIKDLLLPCITKILDYKANLSSQ